MDICTPLVTNLNPPCSWIVISIITHIAMCLLLGIHMFLAVIADLMIVFWETVALIVISTTIAVCFYIWKKDNLN